MKNYWTFLGAPIIIAAVVITSVIASGLLAKDGEERTAAVTQSVLTEKDETVSGLPEDAGCIVTYSWWWPDSTTLSSDMVDAVVYGKVLSVKDITAPENGKKTDYYCAVEMRVAKEYTGNENAPQAGEVITFIAPFSSAAVFYDEIELKPGGEYVAFLFEYDAENNSKGFETVAKYGLSNAHYLILNADSDGMFAASEFLAIADLWKGVPEGYKAADAVRCDIGAVEKGIADILALIK